MIKTSKLFFFFFVATMLASCSAKKDTMVSRKFNALTTKYNILYNGNIAFQEGLDEIESSYKDDFLSRISIEPISFEDRKIAVPVFSGKLAPGEEDDEKELVTFEKAEEKAVKAIQLHSMNFYGREKNTQIDEAYLLLGKSRYYTQRFIPAIEAFNYIIQKYPYANVINETRIWRAKTNIRLENEKLAIESLKIVLKDDKAKESIKEKAHTALAMAYVKTDSIQNAIIQLQQATSTKYDVSQTARNMYVLGQIYVSENKKDSAAIVYQQLMNLRKAPYKFKIHATIENARASVNDSSLNGLVARFDKLIKNRDNRPYLDLLYYQKGLLESQRDSTKRAIVNFQQSLSEENSTAYQKTFSYEKLGDIYFNSGDFVSASAYYDSIVQSSEDRIDLRIRKIRRKHKSLAALISFENSLKVNDSILTLTGLSKEEKQLYFEKYIEELKKKDAEVASKQFKSLDFGNNFGSTTSKQSKQKGKWYFYNRQSLSFGKTEFESTWGNRPLEDNWRISETIKVASSKDSIKANEENSSRYNISTYVNTLPTTELEIDSITFIRNEALYQTGLIYKDQFINTDKAIKRFERLKLINTDKRLTLPIYFHLYKLYVEVANEKLSTSYKEIITKQYPTSKYAQILLNSKEIITVEESGEIESVYKELYYLYKDNKFEDVVSKVTELSPTIQQSKLIAKFELLKALAIGKYQAKEQYKKALEFVFLTYGNSEEGIRAKEILKQLN